MATPATATRGRKKGTAQRAKKAASKKPKPSYKPAGKKAKGKKAPPDAVSAFKKLDKGETVRIDAKRQETALAIIKTDHPGITAAEYALAYKIPSEDLFRMQRFAALYVREMNKKQAAFLMGYDEMQAHLAGELFFNHCYTQLFISEILASAKVDEIVSVGQLVAAAWKEATRADKVLGKAVVTNSTTRLKAIALIGQWLRLGAAPENGGKDDKATGGGVMLVPGDLPADQWEAHAMAEQRALKDSVAVDAVIMPPKHIG
jgi:hypothetical protein